MLFFPTIFLYSAFSSSSDNFAKSSNFSSSYLVQSYSLLLISIFPLPCLSRVRPVSRLDNSSNLAISRYIVLREDTTISLGLGAVSVTLPLCLELLFFFDLVLDLDLIGFFLVLAHIYNPYVWCIFFSSIISRSGTNLRLHTSHLENAFKFYKDLTLYL